MNEETKELQRKLNKDYLTIDDVIQYGSVRKIYLVIGKNPTVKYWFCKNKDGNVLVPADKEPYYSEISHRLLIIGNGFDLHCGTNSRYPVFFDEQFGISLGREIRKLYSEPNENKDGKDIEEQRFIENAKSIFDVHYIKRHCADIKETFRYIEINYLTECKTELLDKIDILDNCQSQKAISLLNQIDQKIRWYQSSFSKWDVVFFLAKLFSFDQNKTNWSDVETIIFKVVNFVFSNNNFGIKLKKIGNTNYFKHLVTELFADQSNKETDLANDMLNELKQFEREFAAFIQRKETLQYYINAKNTIESILHVKNTQIILDVFDFNYSLNHYDAKNYLNLSSKISIHSWTNIHGIADYNKKFNKEKDVKSPEPIFGFDLHKILKHPNEKIYNDPRLKFTKSYRLSTNHVNNIRTKDFQKKIDIITIIGHSLSEADYSYFESIFDKYNLYSGEVILECYYAKRYESEADYTEQVDNLLTNYGNTLEGKHGENIFNKLMLEQRLKILPY